MGYMPGRNPAIAEDRQLRAWGILTLYDMMNIVGIDNPDSTG
jgi:hypothetical protein